MVKNFLFPLSGILLVALLKPPVSVASETEILKKLCQPGEVDKENERLHNLLDKDIDNPEDHEKHLANQVSFLEELKESIIKNKKQILEIRAAVKSAKEKFGERSPKYHAESYKYANLIKKLMNDTKLARSKDQKFKTSFDCTNQFYRCESTQTSDNLLLQSKLDPFYIPVGYVSPESRRPWKEPRIDNDGSGRVLVSFRNEFSETNHESIYKNLLGYDFTTLIEADESLENIDIKLRVTSFNGGFVEEGSPDKFKTLFRKGLKAFRELYEKKPILSFSDVSIRCLPYVKPTIVKDKKELINKCDETDFEIGAIAHNFANGNWLDEKYEPIKKIPEFNIAANINQLTLSQEDIKKGYINIGPGCNAKLKKGARSGLLSEKEIFLSPKGRRFWNGNPLDIAVKNHPVFDSITCSGQLSPEEFKNEVTADNRACWTESAYTRGNYSLSPFSFKCIRRRLEQSGLVTVNHLKSSACTWMWKLATGQDVNDSKVAEDASIKETESHTGRSDTKTGRSTQRSAH